LSATPDSSDGSSVSDKISFRTTILPVDDEPPYTEPEAPQACSTANSPPPPAFSSLYFPSANNVDRIEVTVTEPDSSPPPAFSPAPPIGATSASSSRNVEAETKAALPRDCKGESSIKGVEDGEPPPPYTEGSSPLDSFTYVMATTGGAASIITQVPQGGAALGPGTSLAGL